MEKERPSGVPIYHNYDRPDHSLGAPSGIEASDSPNQKVPDSITKG